ncbi:maleylpyruvate isomerase N-terminal domain-containing protein [Phototrophicus methaneseepsis]|uniref:Maleylpyruvate isomerase N-terminal domain-containing protein n=1 Tax=Phototrophicus methaneseepsis TaxID=2710758 RepID=A0A7S8EBL2_9CHLR|nr:maleylpyruvate isomerase N-terminal domain-containing protein [Phototrophicus methaneseepsis]QPC83977.1 maleylpyruvate isomerase N-terminal domain-containing protein [Phototrophicus methaneseepsis]
MEAFLQSLAAYEAAYQDLFDLLARYPASRRQKKGACGDWSPQQVVAHLSGWIAEAKRRYPRFATGTGNVVYNLDVFNDVSVRRRRDYNWAHTVAELERLVGELAAMARQVTPQQAGQDDRYREWLDSLTEDCRQHTAQLLAFEKASS